MSAAFNTRPWRALRRRSRRLLRIVRERGPSQLQFWVLALLIGIGAGLAVLGFRLGTLRLQHAVYGADDVTLANIAGGLPWAWVLVAPVLGSLVVGIILDRFTPDARVGAISDVIEGAALDGGR